MRVFLPRAPAAGSSLQRPGVAATRLQYVASGTLPCRRASVLGNARCGSGRRFSVIHQLRSVLQGRQGKIGGVGFLRAGLRLLLPEQPPLSGSDRTAQVAKTLDASLLVSLRAVSNGARGSATDVANGMAHPRCTSLASRHAAS